MRGYSLLMFAFIVVFYNEVTNGYPFQTRSRSVHKPLFRDSCSYTCDNLASLLALSRSLDDKEEPVKEVVTAPAFFNADELIMKLVNALVYATTHTAQNHCHCHCTNSVKSAVSDDSRYSGDFVGGSRSRNTDNGHSNDGLLNLDVLNSNKKDNVFDLDLSNQHLIGVGLGGKNQDEGSYALSSSYSTTKSNDSVISTSRNSSTASSKKLNSEEQEQGNTSEDLVNVQVLNPNKNNNVAELALAGQNVLGVGVGGSNKSNLNNVSN